MKDSSLNDFLNSPAMKEYQAKLEEKEKFIKKGPNVIHLEYLGGLISESDIAMFEDKLSENGLELSRFDKDGVMYASLEDFQLTTYFIVSQPLILELLKGIAANSIWDTIKFLSITTWKKVRNRNYTFLRSTEVKKKEITFGLNVKLNKNTSFNFKLDGDIEEKTIRKSLDKVLDFLKEQQLNENFKHADMIYIDKETGDWIRVDTEKELRKQVFKE